ncbi:MAG TPA: nuclear transport factor 2 family protein [Candidatus Angelobacter sp.]|jgi:hypothetical protein|nr:nuclear transport factor 2 family protein [Candidatus Angelobacter sp.]
MRMGLRLFSMLLLIGSLAAGQSQRKTTAQSRAADTSAIIQRLEAELRLALLKHEPSWFEEHLAETYTEIDAQGAIHSRADTLQFLRSSDLSLDTYNLSEGTARTFNGDVVILTGKIEVQWTVKDQSFSGNFRFTRIWVKQGLAWELASQQLTRIPG